MFTQLKTSAHSSDSFTMELKHSKELQLRINFAQLRDHCLSQLAGTSQGKDASAYLKFAEDQSTEINALLVKHDLSSSLKYIIIFKESLSKKQINHYQLSAEQQAALHSIKKAIDQEVQRLRDEIEEALEPEIRYQTDALLASQQVVCETADFKNAFENTLQHIADKFREEKISRDFPSVYISYAWPAPQYEAREYWVQPFLKQLGLHLHLAGIQVRLDIGGETLQGNPLGNSIYKYMEYIRETEYVLLIGTESLYYKHKEGYGLKAVNTELTLIDIKKVDDIQLFGEARVIPLLISGRLQKSLPESYHKYSNILEMRSLSYAANIKEILIRLLPTLEQNAIWNNLFNKHSTLKEIPSKEQVNKLLKLTVYQTLQNDLKQDEIYQQILKEMASSRLVRAACIIDRDLPEPNKHFIARLKYFEAINKSFSSQLTDPKVAALVGTPGIGKSRLAIEYAHSAAGTNQYSLIWFVNGNQAQQDLLRLADHFEEQKNTDKNESIQKVILRLEDFENQGKLWLMIVDDVQSFDTIKKSLPKKGGHLLLTSINKNVYEQKNPIEVTTFTRDDSIQYILKYHEKLEDDKFHQDADSLAELLGDFPLALAQACSYMIKYKVTIQGYNKLFHQLRQKLWAKESDPDNFIEASKKKLATTSMLRIEETKKTSKIIYHLLNIIAADKIQIYSSLVQAYSYMVNHNVTIKKYNELFHQLRQKLWAKEADPDNYIDCSKKTLSTTLKLSIEKIKTTSQLAYHLLNIIAYYAADKIPLYLLKQFANDEIDLNDAIKVLLEHSLIIKSVQNNTISIHKLVQLVLRDYQAENKSEVEYDKEAFEKLDSLFPNFRLLEEKSLLLFFERGLSQRADTREAEVNSERLDKIRRCRQLHSHYQNAIKHYEQKLDTTTKSKSYLKLGESSHRIGNHRLAYNSYIKALQSKDPSTEQKDEKVELMHIHFSLELSKRVLSIKDDKNEGIQQAIEIAEKYIAINSFEMLNLYIYYADKLCSKYNLSNNSESLKSGIHYFEQALKIAKNIDSNNHSLISSILSRLARVTRIIGNNQSAQAYEERGREINSHLNTDPESDISLAEWQRRLGNIKKFDTTNYLKILATLQHTIAACQKSNNPKLALGYHEEAIELVLKHFPKNSVTYLTLLMHSSKAWATMGNIELALSLYFEAKEIAEAIGDKDNFTIGKIHFDIGYLYFNHKKDYVSAYSHFKNSFTILTHITEKDSEMMFDLLFIMAECEFKFCQFKKSLDLYMKGLKHLALVRENREDDMFFRFHYGIMDCYFALNLYQDVLNYFNSLHINNDIEFTGENSDIYAGIYLIVAESYQFRGDIELAILYAKKASKISIRDSLIAQNLGCLLFCIAIQKNKDHELMALADQNFVLCTKLFVSSGTYAEYSNYLFYHGNFSDVIKHAKIIINNQSEFDGITLVYNKNYSATLPEIFQSLIPLSDKNSVFNASAYAFFLAILACQKLNNFKEASAILKLYSQVIVKGVSDYDKVLYSHACQLVENECKETAKESITLMSNTSPVFNSQQSQSSSLSPTDDCQSSEKRASYQHQ